MKNNQISHPSDSSYAKLPKLSTQALNNKEDVSQLVFCKKCGMFGAILNNKCVRRKHQL